MGDDELFFHTKNLFTRRRRSDWAFVPPPTSMLLSRAFLLCGGLYSKERRIVVDRFSRCLFPSNDDTYYIARPLLHLQSGSNKIKRSSPIILTRTTISSATMTALGPWSSTYVRAVHLSCAVLNVFVLSSKMTNERPSKNHGCCVDVLLIPAPCC
jgi:hypothetical protein